MERQHRQYPFIFFILLSYHQASCAIVILQVSLKYILLPTSGGEQISASGVPFPRGYPASQQGKPVLCPDEVQKRWAAVQRGAEGLTRWAEVGSDRFFYSQLSQLGAITVCVR